jgi:hypothetical protein
VPEGITEIGTSMKDFKDTVIMAAIILPVESLQNLDIL